ncbi:helix-turn-helix transcriptional regulator [Actinoplanes bogorensis]|uniref:Helix-turn-helix transcriptional regulator n=1 Tax=Paractinoplanes bogorensis TaxID=1610840 RepID=A0ABS5YWU1_9ACTN|nr:helix-turn-helix transcriptional regulator [Actinoplanes bogorensis]MBU2667903.1 helix-turn-helix transcriptional regulator [Actinoplanes bogorensis]
MVEQVDYGPWIDLAGDQADAFPAERIAKLLRSTLKARAVSLNWAQPAAAGARVWPPIVDLSLLDEFLRSGALWRDPLVNWFERTRDPGPQAGSRVPGGFGEPRSSAHWGRVMRREGIQDRLAVPVRLGAHTHVAFVAAAGDRDFGDADLAVVRRLQPLLRSLYRQADVLERSRALAPMAGGARLTGRERAVLSLLADGHSAAVIGRRLAISERTVHKHLEHLYRKLEANDRLTAVLSAQRAGILVPAV